MKKVLLDTISRCKSLTKSVARLLSKKSMNGSDGGPRLPSFIMKNPVKSVGMKLFLTFFVSIVLFVLVVGISSFQISRTVIKEKVAEASHQTIIQTSEKLDMMFQSFTGVFTQISTNFEVNYLTDNAKSLTRIDQLDFTHKVATQFNNLLFANRGLAAIHLLPVQAEAKVEVSTSGMHNQKYKEAKWFNEIIKADGEPVWLDAKKSGYDANPETYALGQLLKSRVNGEASYVLFMEFRLKTLEDALKLIKLGDTGKIQIVNANNQIIFSAQKDSIESQYSIDMRKSYGESPSKLEFIKSNESDEQLIVYHQSNLAKWLVIGNVAVSELVKDTETIFDVTVGVTIFAMIVAVAIGYFVVRAIGRPLVELRNLMKEGERGNLSVRTHFKSRDEIGQLGESFNQMMEKITLLVRNTSVSAQEVLRTSADLSEASKQTAISAKEIAVATEQIAGGATSLAVEAEKVNEITQSIGSQMKNVISVNTQMGSSASEVQKAGEQGTIYMSELITKTNSTEEMTRSMAEKVDKLKESTRSIRKILDVLNNITKQTNILSLNAAIEAARAGAAGKGFMVVADEIRKLADQSRKSIDVVAQITEGIQKEIEETVGVLSKAQPVFQEQIYSVKEADVIFKEVQTHMHGFITQLNEVTNSIHLLDQSQSVLSEAMGNVSAFAEESSATSEEVASLSNEQTGVSEGLVRLSDRLEQLSSTLKDSLTKFKV